MSRRAAKAAVPTWRGHLTRTAAGTTGELCDGSGWKLALVGIPARAATPAKIYVRADVAATGADAPGRAVLAELPFLAGDLVQGDAGWTGELAIRDLVLIVTGTLASPGRIDLTGAG